MADYFAGGYGSAAPPPSGSGNWGGSLTGPIRPSMGTIGQPRGIAPVPWGSGSEDPTQNPYPGGSPLGGVTRRGSQMVDAQGNVIGHYDDNNQPVYLNGQVPQGPQRIPGGGDPTRTPQLPPWMHGPMLPQPAPPVRMQMPMGGVQDVPSAYAPTYLQQGGSLTGESTQYPAYNMSNVGRSGYRS